MRQLPGLLALLLCSGTPTASEMLPLTDADAPRDWSEVAEIERRAQSRYDSLTGSWLMASDGRIAIVQQRGDEDVGPRSAMLGRYAYEGPWLRVELGGHAIDLDSLEAAERAEYEAWQASDGEDAEQEADAAEGADAADDEANAVAHAALAATAQALEDAEEDPGQQAFMENMRRPRYLRVPYRGGELLVREAFLPMIANGWKGKGPLELVAEAWRLPAAAQPAPGEWEFEVEDPLHAGLPRELSRLLRAEPVQARVVEVFERADTLKWKRQRAAVHLRLDRGERDGLFVGMLLRGLPPDEALHGEIVAVEADGARLKLELERFSPRESPVLPVPGIRFTSRSPAGACPIDTSAAVQAKVRSVATPPELLVWDEEGFAWFELVLDQGAAQGLIAGDRLYPDDESAEGEGRVLHAGSGQATVLWRVQRWHEEMKVRLPAVGHALVTPAWQRAEWDVFGAADQARQEAEAAAEAGAEAEAEAE
jgi:hypothetical protein